MRLFLILFILQIALCIEWKTLGDHDTFHGEVAMFLLDSGLLNTSDSGLAGAVRYDASLLHAPDLPSWLSYDYQPLYNSGVVFGLPPDNITSVQLKVVAHDTVAFTSQVFKLLINVLPSPERRRFEVQLKITNIRVTDLLANQMLYRLFAVFHQELWPESATTSLCLTRLEASATVSASSPVPADSAGVILRVASAVPFSRRLRALQREVRPLWSRAPCPRNFRRSREERHFRGVGLHIDWCWFKLFDGGSVVNVSTTISPVPPAEVVPPRLPRLGPLPGRQNVPRRQVWGAWLSACLGPVICAVLLCAMITVAMWNQQSDDDRAELVDTVFASYDCGEGARGSLRRQPRSGRSPSLSSCGPGSLRRSVLRDVSPRLISQSDSESDTMPRQPHPLYCDRTIQQPCLLYVQQSDFTPGRVFV